MADSEVVSEAIVVQPEVRLGTFGAETPGDIVERATTVSKELAKIIEKQKLYSPINGKKFVRVEGWTTLGAMLGIVPREIACTEQENGDFEAAVELVRVSDGAVIGRGSAICGMDEKTWGTRPRYARRSMSLTRATGKAFRLGFSWIMTLAGYEPTPLEEMSDVEPAHEEPGETPINKGLRLYAELCAKAIALGLHPEQPPENVTIDRLRDMYDVLDKATKAEEEKIARISK